MTDDTIKIAMGYNIPKNEIADLISKVSSRDEAIKKLINKYKQSIAESIATTIVEQEIIEFKTHDDTIEGYVFLGTQTIPDYWIETQMILNKYGLYCNSMSTRDLIVIHSAEIFNISAEDKHVLENIGWTVKEKTLERHRRKDVSI